MRPRFPARMLGRISAIVAAIACVLIGCARDTTAQTPPSGVTVVGVVKDQTGAVLPGATVTLVAGAGAPMPLIVTDTAGAFRFDRVPPGSYDVRVEFPGFAASITRLRVGARAPKALTVVMDLKGLTQEVSVSGGENQASADSGSNLNAVTVDQKALDALPVLDQDIVGAMSRFLDSSALGTGGATLVVDGVEVNALQLSTSAIQEIKINKDPYAAEFSRPGRGRIHITTKPGGRDYRGTLNVRFRDSALYARNAFALTKPPEQRRIFEGTLGGPVPGTSKTTFLFSGSHNAEDSQAIVFADTLDGPVQANVPTPSRNTLLAGTFNHRHGDAHTISVRLSHRVRSEDNQDVGGTSLPESASDSRRREDEATYSHQTILSPTLLHEFRLLGGIEEQRQNSLLSAPRIVVPGAFVGGGAQNDSLRTEHHLTLVDAITWSPGAHVVKAGVNIPDWSRRRYDDMSNTGGTFYFSSLQDYALGQPYSFTLQQGNGHVVFLEKVLGGFVQDDIRLRPNLSIDLGLRYDWQSDFHDNNNFAPRFSFAYAPGARVGTVIRGGFGLFYDRTGPGPVHDLLSYDGRHLQQYVMTDPGYPNPLQPGQSLDAQAVNLVQLAPDAAIPRTLRYSIGVERQLRPKTTLAVNFVGSRGYGLFLSRDINAPLPPAFGERPDPSRGVVRQIESTGTMRTASLQFTLRGEMSRFFNGTVQYSFGRANNDTGGVSWMPPNSYDLSQEYGRASFNRRHALDLFGAFNVGRLFTLGASLEMSSGRPYSLTTGLDDFHTGSADARPPGVPRNSLEGPGFANLDLRWSKEFAVPGLSTPAVKRTVTLGLDAFNVLNRVNYSSFVGNLSSPFFGQAISARAPRRMQLSLRLRY